jgi:hypothetical protein
MASYTVELRKLIDLFGRDTVEGWFKNYNLEYYLTPVQIAQIQKFNVWSKDRLATKIVDHYYMREIGFETPTLFEHYAKVTMQEIMERYLPKIYSNFLEYDPLSNVDFTEEYTREILGTSEGKSNSTSQNNASGLSIINDTPQKRITKQDLNTGAYATNVSQSDTESNVSDETNANSSSNTVEKFTRHEEGDNGVIITNQRLVKEFREIIVAIDEEIINELGKLFMAIY